MNPKNYIFEGLIVLTLVLGLMTYFLLNSNDQKLSEQAEIMSHTAPQESDVKASSFTTKEVSTVDSTDLLKTEPRIILKLHGSNTIGGKLVPAMAAAYLKTLGADVTVSKPLEQVNESQVIGYLPESHQIVGIEIKAHGSTTGFTSLIDKTTDIAMSSRPIKHEENLDLILENGDMTNPENEHIIALDGLAIVVHPDNPLKTITTGQLAEIFSGKINNWGQIGGIDGKINLYARDDQSGTFDTFKALILKKYKRSLANAKRFESNEELVNQVRNDRLGIGFSGLAYADKAMILQVAADIGLPAISPNQFSISSEDYPLSRRLYLYANKSKVTNSHVKQFIQFSVSQSGQHLAEVENFIPQKIISQKPSDISNFPTEYQQLVRDSERLSMTFRMRADRAEIDNKSAQDIENLVTFLSEKPYEKLQLIGLSAGESNDVFKDHNRALVRSRLLAVKLKERGVKKIEVVAFGELIPIDSNKDANGVYRNNRTEVWLVGSGGSS